MTEKICFQRSVVAQVQKKFDMEISSNTVGLPKNGKYFLVVAMVGIDHYKLQSHLSRDIFVHIYSSLQLEQLVFVLNQAEELLRRIVVVTRKNHIISL